MSRPLPSAPKRTSFASPSGATIRCRFVGIKPRNLYSKPGPKNCSGIGLLQSLTYVVEMLTGSISCFTVHMAGPPDQVSELGAAYLYAWSTATGSFGARNGAKIADR